MRSTLTTVWVSAAVSAVVGATAHGIWVGISQRFQNLRRRFAADHYPLFDASWAPMSAPSTTNQSQIQVRCAPDRSLRKSEINPDAAMAFLKRAFPSKPASGYEQQSDFEFSVSGTGVQALWWAEFTSSLYDAAIDSDNSP